MAQSVFERLTAAFLFHPTRGQSHSPAVLGLPFEDLRLQTEDGVHIQAWWIGARPERDLGVVVLMFHGNAGNLSMRLPDHLDLHTMGASVLAVEYRGYGDSEGQPSEAGLERDARAGWAEAKRRAEARGARIVVMGRSLGGAVAVGLAAGLEGLDGLWLESTFTSLADVASTTGIPFAGQLAAYRFDSLGRIADVDAPVLLVHGVRDELIPIAQGRALADAITASGGSVTFIPVPGGGHNDTPQVAGHHYGEAVRAFLRSVVDRP